MAAGAKSVPVTNGTHASSKPVELAISLPNSPGTRIHLHLTVLAASVILFLTTAGMDAGQGAATMGSFVYAMPDVCDPGNSDIETRADFRLQRYNPSQPLSTPLYTLPSSLDFTNRIAKIVVRKSNRPCYVGSSINLSGAVGGGTVNEEMEAFRAIVDVVTAEVERASTAHDEV